MEKVEKAKKELSEYKNLEDLLNDRGEELTLYQLEKLHEMIKKQIEDNKRVGEGK